MAFGANLPILSKDESSEILQRGARAMNNLHFEEVMPGNLEKECIEETCDSQGSDSAYHVKPELSERPSAEPVLTSASRSNNF